MTLCFERVDYILKNDFSLLSKIRKDNTKRHSYYFKDRYIYTKKSEVAREIVELKNGGVGGYIYVGHLSEYNNCSKKHKDGYLNIGHMEESEFIDLAAKVTKEYKYYEV